MYQTKFLSIYYISILGKVGFQSDQITAASWSGNTCQSSNQLIITLIRLLFGFEDKDQLGVNKTPVFSIEKDQFKRTFFVNDALIFKTLCFLK